MSAPGVSAAFEETPREFHGNWADTSGTGSEQTADSSPISVPYFATPMQGLKTAVMTQFQ
jgi:hypothetical protein